MSNMVLRLSEEETELLRRIAEREHRSMHDVALSAVRDRLTERQRRREQVMATFDAEHAELLTRLAQ
jgi:predicted transcriptional regulator